MKEDIIKKQIENAPSELREYILNYDWSRKLNRLFIENSIVGENITKIENEVLLVLVKLDLESNLQKNLSENTNLNPQVIQNLVQKIKKEIFEPIRQYLPKGIEEETEPENLIEDHEGNLDNVLPKNLPTEHRVGTSLEEKIAPHVGTPGQKISWEERKKQAGDRIIAENKYGGKDPYREPPTP